MGKRLGVCRKGMREMVDFRWGICVSGVEESEVFTGR